MATLFPTSISFAYPYQIRSAWNTLISPMGAGMEIRHSRQAFPKREIVPQFSWLTPTELNALWQFYQARKGALESFHFVSPLVEQWYGEYVGLGDAAEDTFDLPSLTTDEPTLAVYLNGTLKTGGGVDYTFSPSSGENGADQIVMTAIPALYDILTADYQGQHRFLCRFQSDNLNRSLISMLCYNSEFVLQEVLDITYGGVLALVEGGFVTLAET